MFAKLVYDSTRNVSVLFGGSSASGWAIDTWEWDGETWTQIEDTGPDGQVAHETMTYDAARKVAVLDGGSATSGGVGTWTWDGTVWTQLADTGPSKRYLASLSFDAKRERAVLFGGSTSGSAYSGVLEKSTWEWDGAVWEQVEDIGPSGRWCHASAWAGSGVLLYGGLAGPSKPLGDTWEWDGEHWRQRQDIGPSPRYLPAMAWDTARSRTIIFGGAIGEQPWAMPDQVYGDTWEAFEEEP
jgi:hypothetical protein